MSLMNTVLSNKVIKYGLVGLMGTFVHFCILILLVNNLGCNAVIASTAGFIVVLIISYFINKYWTFKSKEKRLQEFTKYCLVSLIGLFLNTSIVFICTSIFELNYIVGQFVVTLIVPASNFILNNVWAFKKELHYIKKEEK